MSFSVGDLEEIHGVPERVPGEPFCTQRHVFESNTNGRVLHAYCPTLLRRLVLDLGQRAKPPPWLALERFHPPLNAFGTRHRAAWFCRAQMRKGLKVNKGSVFHRSSPLRRPVVEPPPASALLCRGGKSRTKRLPLDRALEAANHHASALSGPAGQPIPARPQRKEVFMAPPDQPAAMIAAAFGRASA